jgi:hypothetical protein
MRVYAYIMARSGSKGVRHKDIREIAGHPLLAYSIAFAKKWNLIDSYMRYSHAATRRPHWTEPSGRLMSSSGIGGRSGAQANVNTITLSAATAAIRRWPSMLWIVTGPLLCFSSVSC